MNEDDISQNQEVEDDTHHLEDRDDLQDNLNGCLEHASETSELDSSHPDYALMIGAKRWTQKSEHDWRI
jgi:hypothetical protein